jgi:hypothetical protein
VRTRVAACPLLVVGAPKKKEIKGTFERPTVGSETFEMIIIPLEVHMTSNVPIGSFDRPPVRDQLNLMRTLRHACRRHFRALQTSPMRHGVLDSPTHKSLNQLNGYIEMCSHQRTDTHNIQYSSYS